MGQRTDRIDSKTEHVAGTKKKKKIGSLKNNYFTVNTLIFSVLPFTFIMPRTVVLESICLIFSLFTYHQCTA